MVNDIIAVISTCLVAIFFYWLGYQESLNKFGIAQDKKKKIAEAEPIMTTPPVFKSTLWKIPIPLNNKNKQPKK